MKNYLQGRRNPITEATPDELNDLLAAVADAFGETWLEADDSAPLQQLWRRDDGLASNQLFLIGHALRALSVSHPKWVETQIAHIKSGEANNRRGAMFELLGLNIFTGHGLDVAPTTPNAPGFDGVIGFGGANELALSLKSYGPSYHEQTVGKNAANIERDFVAALRAQSKTG